MAMSTWWIIIAIVVVGLVIWYVLSEEGEGQGPTSKGPSSKPGEGPSSGPGESPLGSDQGPSGDKPPQGPSGGPTE